MLLHTVRTRLRGAAGGSGASGAVGEESGDDEEDNDEEYGHSDDDEQHEATWYGVDVQKKILFPFKASVHRSGQPPLLLLRVGELVPARRVVHEVVFVRVASSLASTPPD